MEKLNLTQQKHTFTNQKKCTKTQNKHKKLKPNLVASYNIWPWNRRGPILVSALHKFVTYLLRHLPTYLQPRDSHRTNNNNNNNNSGKRKYTWRCVKPTVQMTDCKYIPNNASCSSQRTARGCTERQDPKTMRMLWQHTFTYLNIAKRLFGDEADGNWEEVVCVTSDAELHRAGLVGRINHRQTPL